MVANRKTSVQRKEDGDWIDFFKQVNERINSEYGEVRTPPEVNWEGLIVIAAVAMVLAGTMYWFLGRSAAREIVETIVEEKELEAWEYFENIVSTPSVKETIEVISHQELYESISRASTAQSENYEKASLEVLRESMEPLIEDGIGLYYIAMGWVTRPFIKVIEATGGAIRNYSSRLMTVREEDPLITESSKYLDPYEGVEDMDRTYVDAIHDQWLKYANRQEYPSYMDWWKNGAENWQIDELLLDIFYNYAIDSGSIMGL